MEFIWLYKATHSCSSPEEDWGENVFRWKWAGKSLQLKERSNIIFQKMETKSLNDLLVEYIDFILKFFFQSWIVISIISDWSHSGPAQESIIPIIGNVWEKNYR